MELKKYADISCIKLETCHLADIALVIMSDCRAQQVKIPFAAKPYVNAMACLTGLGDSYGCDSGASVVAYALCNLSQWRGPVARAIKAELNRRLKQPQKKEGSR